MNAYALNDWDELEAAYFGKNAGMYTVYQERAYANEPAAAGAAAGVPARMPGVSPRPRIREQKKNKENRLRNQQILEQHRQKERYISCRRFKEAMVALVCIAMVAGMFAFLLFRQSQITSLNFQNNAAQRRINTMKQETRQIQMDLSSDADLAQIRWDAMEGLGMQDPSSRQIVTVKLPSTDQLVTNNFNSSAINSKASLASAKANLAQYYASLN